MRFLHDGGEGRRELPMTDFLKYSVYLLLLSIVSHPLSDFTENKIILPKYESQSWLAFYQHSLKS